VIGDLVVRACEEEEAIAARRAELHRLSELLAERELEQAEIRAELARFQYRYYQAVGARYVELDELQARIAEKRSANDPAEDSLSGRARRTREQADRSAREYRAWEEGPPPPSEPPSLVSDEAKRLYRRIAAAIHPDRAEDEATRGVRTALMAELNEAYARGDISRMEDILKTWETSPEAVTGDDPSAVLDRLERAVVQLREKIVRVENEAARIANTPMHRLMLREREAADRGRNLLVELAADLDRRILQAREELAAL
jgi:hypothetical protein